jgi:hypothetical protein
MSGLIANLAGAGGAAQNTGNYYQNAMQNEINAAGSPAATDFIRLQNAALRPQFLAQDQQMSAGLAAQGITNSGAARANAGNLAAQQSGQIAAADAPLYQGAMNAYGQINAQMPGAQAQSYNDAIQQFYQALQGAGSAAAMAFGGGGGGGASPLDFSGGMPTPSQIGTGPGGNTGMLYQPSSNDYYGSNP